MPSSFIDGIAYHRPNGRMRIRFADGREYVYAGVPEDVADALGEAWASPDQSVGRIFNRRVRNRYPVSAQRP